MSHEVRKTVLVEKDGKLVIRYILKKSDTGPFAYEIWTKDFQVVD